ncbi:ATP-dependent helicase HrpB [Hymenobacter edaphi]|uniref:ATP-dependent helicase HrpB n=1 Tax=Hymenobacter edaphi TaxID=2211146 RepID=A0A328BIV7_9BACT|nr:ATP-dependent helicase HrpB [Hymenobacter edaphi]RAK66887.1 ATP-dependent helicase HrpB [Hymenobacter edaphi]
MTFPDLPIRAALPELLAALEAGNRAVLQAPPGAGKTTLVPLALLAAPWRPAEGKIIVLEPRRLAARAAATRMAQLLGEPVGQTVGYRVRLENKVSARTRIEVVTEGILTRLVQDDPALEGVAAVLFDEFHERSLQADLGLALALDAQQVLRPDLRLVVMSATLDAARLGPWLQAPVVTSEGRMYPVETIYLSPRRAAGLSNRPGERLAELTPAAVREALGSQAGDVLVFLPGLADQRRVGEKLEATLPADVDLHVLHGELPLDRQDAALRPAPAGRRKVVLATSIAETSLTIEGVRVVVDGGFARVPRFVARTGLTTLETVPVSQAAADQRRGRAGRLGPGVCYRLWPEIDQAVLPAHLPPEILTADLSALALELALWGADAPNLLWLDAPPAPALALARELLGRLGALTPAGQPTPHGRELARLGLPPRLGHLVVRGRELGHGPTACALAALLAERDILRATDGRPAPPDLRLRLEALQTGRAPLPGLLPDSQGLRRVREAATALRGRAGVQAANLEPDLAGLLAALAYPDRLGQREGPDRLRLVTGQRVQLPAEFFAGSDVFFAAAHLDGPANAPRAALAAPLSKAEVEELFGEQISEQAAVQFDAATGRVLARRLRRLGALVLAETNLPNPSADDVAAALLTAVLEGELRALSWTAAAQHVRERLGFLHHLAPADWPAVSTEALLADAAEWLAPNLAGLRSLADVGRLDVAELLLQRLPGGWSQRQELDRLAPSHLEVPSGSHVRIDYGDAAAPVLAVKLQELFGLVETPAVAAGRVPLLLHLLSPGGRPAQVTRDLRSFWEKGYFEVRKDLKGRYPRHPWPDDPMNHIPTKLTKRRLEGL